MIQFELNGFWKLKEATSQDDWINGVVPGSVMNDLLTQGKIENPFYRDNEDQAIEIASKDYIYTREFEVTEELLQHDKLILKCDGLDTITDIHINGEKIASTDNMHRTYEFDVISILKVGVNEITITLYSPINYINAKQEKVNLTGVDHAVEGYPHIRKTHSMFGWDWGPKIPDLGIWRSIALVGWNVGRVEDVYITQNHDNDQVSLDVRVNVESFVSAKTDVEVRLINPKGQVESKKVTLDSLEEVVHFDVKYPELWWPNGYGEQPLYHVEVVLSFEEKQLDQKEYTIGLRTIEIKNEPDQWGKSFEFIVNGVPIFAMGANYIPEDSLLARNSKCKTEQLIKDCIAANFNIVRIWGGGHYPEDYFMELCNTYGLIVWQDFMFACSVYDLTDEFKENIKQEAIDNIKRLRHHPSLGIWCGNNEVEEGWVHWGFEKTPNAPKLRTDYIKIFEVLLPEIVKEYDPQTFYWPSSPSTGGGFDRPRDPDDGDVHYWEVWHGLKPFTEYRKFYFRFCSEFGFQSFPSMKTIETFTEPEDRNIFSYVMEKHQKNDSANGKILYYLSENYLYPKDFDSLLYTSQLLQADAIKYGVEHWRRNRGRCMGSIYWQLNDCWPVASWSSIDNEGRWKALHYFAKKFYAPVLLSIEEQETSAGIYVTNETMNSINCRVEWKLRSNSSEVIKAGFVETSVEKLSAAQCETLSFNDVLSGSKIRETYLECTLFVDGKEDSKTTLLFTKPKHFAFLDPKIEVEIVEETDKFVITLNSKAFAKYVELDLTKADCKFTDNYFDISAGEAKTVEISKGSLSQPFDVNTLKEQLTVRSIFNMA